MKKPPADLLFTLLPLTRRCASAESLLGLSLHTPVDLELVEALGRRNKWFETPAAGKMDEFFTSGSGRLLQQDEPKRNQEKHGNVIE
ncbi:hypothetical protein MPTK1_5g12320 [Marchantia polymorpha subsp. ruderalis]|uniref:Uncharacterized protein n=2 Tax=Marchantia polymorpha TaxID=3197 RepID=A0AAF6BHK3_MARPO|nr:hypothetical protein MARPO_0092s0074 [Marchantia polymorpha]BBN11487.1 hypothetical protein Mp_5g12320 [Marchantia polymorpha subsp. ruderalis]|eukprot:PTQ33113.1 hypothetical protein MARPO_0092s0074 [Marchantia polymorpha]